MIWSHGWGQDEGSCEKPFQSRHPLISWEKPLPTLSREQLSANTVVWEGDQPDIPVWFISEGPAVMQQVGPLRPKQSGLWLAPGFLSGTVGSLSLGFKEAGKHSDNSLSFAPALRRECQLPSMEVWLFSFKQTISKRLKYLLINSNKDP